MVNNQWQRELRLQMPRVISPDYPGDPRVITRTVKCGKGRWGKWFESVGGWDTQQSPLALHLKEWGPKPRAASRDCQWRRQDCSLLTLLKKAELGLCLWFRYERKGCGDLLPLQSGQGVHTETGGLPGAWVRETCLKKPELKTKLIWDKAKTLGSWLSGCFRPTLIRIAKHQWLTTHMLVGLVVTQVDPLSYFKRNFNFKHLLFQVSLRICNVLMLTEGLVGGCR